MGHPLEDSSHTYDSLKYPWKSLLSTSPLYETEIKTSRSNLHLSFELWKRLAELTAETLGISAKAQAAATETKIITPPPQAKLITGDRFVKTIIPPSLSHAALPAFTFPTLGHPTSSLPKKPTAPQPSPAARAVASRGRTEKGLIEALIEARRTGATGTAFKRGPGIYSSVIKGPASQGNKPKSDS